MRKRIMPIPSGKTLRAEILLPGSKSITHRALLMAALAEGACRINHPLRAEDTELTANAIRQLGARVNWEDDQIIVLPPAKRWSTPSNPIWLGNSGTSARLLAALMAAGEGRFILDGAPRLRERPLGPVLNALQNQGVQVKFVGQAGYLPVELGCGGLRGGEIQVDARQSSQFLSALLIAAPSASRECVIRWLQPVASFPYVRLTLAMMERFGIRFQWLAENRIAVRAPQRYAAFHYDVEGDCSTASYFWAAAAITAGEALTTPIKPDAIQGDCRLLDVLEQMGCSIQWEEHGVRVIGARRLRGVDLDMNAMPDMVPTVSVVAAFAEGKTRIRNVAHLRIKESDRLRAVAGELTKMGVQVDELEDGLIIEGGSPHGADIDAHDDHRIAMAFAVAGLKVDGIQIEDAAVVSKSFPSFWDVFETMQDA